MKCRLLHRDVLLLVVSILIVILCGKGMAAAQDYTYSLVPCELDNFEQCMEITLPRLDEENYGLAVLSNGECTDDTIQIPNGRSIYAFLVNGFNQNHNFELFHFYNFAKEIFQQALDMGEKAYVHFAWWNNLLAPYMEKTLHDSSSSPGWGALNALSDYFQFDYFLATGPSKARPAEDYQFQKDAKAVLEVIHKENPDAIIILVGHSMGGDSVIRLADSMPADFPIALLAPIDPVGNRTCLPVDYTIPVKDMLWANTTCYGAYNFTRFQATHTDWYWYPYRISFEDNNISYLYHRWQTEAMFPFDYGCPDHLILCPLQLHMLLEPDDERVLPDAYLFRHSEPRSLGIGQGITNVQSKVSTSWWSGIESYPNWWNCWNCGGFMDGHGEIVGFRGVAPFTEYSWPLALKAQGDWPSLDKEQNPPVPDDEIRRKRIEHLKAWETNPCYLDGYLDCENGGNPVGEIFAPIKPHLCIVSKDLGVILAFLLESETPEVNHPQVADPNGPYEAECEGPVTTVHLDGSGSSDPEGSSLDFNWHVDCPGVSPEDLANSFDNPESATPVLTVDTSSGCAVQCTVELSVSDNPHGNKDHKKTLVTIDDTVSPDITCPENITIECDESTDTSNTDVAAATDTCSPEIDFSFVDMTIDGELREEYSIERTWSATDYCGNISKCMQTIEVVDTTPPDITSISATPDKLWPPNGKLIPVEVSVTAIDNCDSEPDCSISSIVNSETTEGSVDSNIIGESTAQLRSKRLGTGNGRVYTITVECKDATGNSTVGETIVTVPHEQGKNKDK